MRSLLLLIAAFVAATSATKSYSGFSLYRIDQNNDEQKRFLTEITGNDEENFDFFTHANKLNRPVEVLVAPEAQNGLEAALISKEIPFKVLVQDFEDVIQKEKLYQNQRSKLRSGRIGFNQYYKHDEINIYLDLLAQQYPEIAKVETIGLSYEQREMKAIRISSDFKGNKPVIFVDAGIHAREWIAPAMSLYLINQLVENSTVSYMFKNVDWVILPSVNPDGYEYTWTNDRMWRKTRSPGNLCDGCDPNRNFGFHWMESGASQFECSETFAGQKAFSEVEARNLRDYLNQTANVVAYLTLHSYGQYLLYPWGYSDDLCENWKELDDLGNKMNDAIKKVRGTEYTVGSSTRVLYAAAGASDDWAKSTGVDIVYTMELPGGGSGGFDLPPSKINGVVEETFLGVQVLQEYVETKYA